MKIALAGFGQEGRASYEYWNVAGNELAVVDERAETANAPSGVRTITGPDAFSQLAEFDLIIRSPGINPKKLPYGDKVWSATNEFFDKCPAPIIGVTGTKGKGTTSSLITSILTAAGFKTHLVGNIGTPALEVLPEIGPDEIVIFELSSFQLWDIKKSPHVAVVLGIEPDHLDVHDDMDDYVDAKANIVKYQTSEDTMVYNLQNQISVSIAQRSQAKKLAYPDMNIAEEYGSSLVIPGQHNIENACAAVAATSEYAVDSEKIKQGLKSFSGLPHRIKFIREVGGVRYYDDSYSSAPTASVAALKSFTQPKHIILGGYEKHAEYSIVSQYVANEQTVKKAYLIGQTRHRIASAFQAAGIAESRYVVLDTTNFSEIVSLIASEAQAGEVVLLSPGCASFDMFKNFTDRGEQFVALVNTL